MSTTTLVKNARTVIAPTSNAAGSTTRGTVDLRTAQGGLLTMKLTNGGVGPTLQAQASVLVACTNGATPAAGSAGADWKTLWAFGGGTAPNLVTEQSFLVDPGVMHLEVEVTGNTGQAVTCEAFLSEITAASSV